MDSWAWLKLLQGFLLTVLCLQSRVRFIMLDSKFYLWFHVLGFLPDRLLWIRREWDSKAVSAVEDSYGQEWVSVFGLAVNCG